MCILIFKLRSDVLDTLMFKQKFIIMSPNNKVTTVYVSLMHMLGVSNSTPISFLLAP